MNVYRKIIHIDMDAFFASVEQRDFPAYQGKPLVVGYVGNRGVVAAASYEARKYGVFSAMSSKIALSKCPHLIFVKPRFDVYKQVSLEIQEILFEYTDLIEPLSLDEAFLDVTENKFALPSATLIAKEIKKKIYAKTQLTASAGISINKFLAKIASDYQKPNGLYLIPPEKAVAFVEKLPIEKFHGIGKVTAQKMKKMGIFTGSDLKTWDKTTLIRNFGKVGSYYYDIARAIDNRQVNPHRVRKSIGSENTFAQDLTDKEQMISELDKLAFGLIEIIQKRKIIGRTLTLKIKFYDFEQITRSKTTTFAIDSFEVMKKIYVELIQNLDTPHKAVRLLGLSISNLESNNSKYGLQLHLDF